MLDRAFARGLACLLIVVAAYACGDDDDDTPRDAGTSDAGGRAGTDSQPSGSGGRGGAGSGGSSGASGASGDAGSVYQCEPPPAPTGGDAKEGEACCSGLGVCTENPTGPGSEAYGLSSCTAGRELKCVPVAPVDGDAGADDDAGPGGVPPSCRMTLASAGAGGPDFEGRCVPSCFLTGDPSSSNLVQSTCDDDSKCVPCFSPITGQSTGACNQPGDAPVEAAPAGFAACGEGDIGYCVPMGASGGVMLPQLTCGDGNVCAPKARVLDPDSCFAHCVSPLGGAGACIAAFIVPEAQRNLLGKVTCEDGELCVPCVSPIDQMRTGACD
jgi:hypothetical protein